MPLKDKEAKRLYMRDYLRKRREDPEFREKANRKTVQCRNKSPERIKKHAEATARYRKAHPERIKASMKKVDQLPHRKEMHAKWIKSLSQELRSKLQKKWRIERSLRSHENGGVSTIEQWKQRLALYGNSCAYCSSPLLSKAEIEHVIPVAKGGSGWPSNLVPACRSCNARKNTAPWLPHLPQPSTDYFNPAGRKASGQSAPRLTVKES